MSKLISNLIIFFLIFFLNFPKLILAQETNFKQNYLNQLTKFNGAQEEYITAKSAYLSFKTATSKNQAFIKTKSYLREANLLYSEYIKLVEAIGNKVDWQNSTINRDDQINVINSELNFLSGNLDKIESSQTLEELPQIAQDFKNQIQTSTKPKIDMVVVNFNIASAESTKAEFNNIATSLIELATVRTDASQASLIANWRSEIENINSSTQDLLDESKTELEKLGETRSIPQNILDKITRAKLELKRSKQLFLEILKIL